YPLQMLYGQGTRGIHADTSLGGDCDGGAGICSRSWGPAIPSGNAFGAPFDHANELYRVGHTFDNGFTVAGGNDRTTLYLSGDDRIFDNPFWSIFDSQNSSDVGRVYGNLNAEYLATSWLKVNYTLGADYAADERLEGCAITSASPCVEGRVIEGKIINYAIDH